MAFSLILTFSTQFHTLLPTLHAFAAMSKLPSSWPKEIRTGSVTVRIYRVSNRKAGKRYTEFRVSYYDAHGRRRFESFAEYGDAERKARSVAKVSARQDGKGLTLSADERLIYLRSLDLVRDVGVPLDAAASEFAQGRKIIGDHSLVEAARLFVRVRGDCRPVFVAAVKDELIALRTQRTKQGRPASERYLAD
ncbi:MAG: hypothetical protein DME24_25840, partial [Verrucomicrobia bacterium]